MAKYDEVKGFTSGISDEEFEVLLRLSFTLNGFCVEKIKRSTLVTNDFVLGLSRVEKRFLRGEKKYNYVAYVDRKKHEFSDKWMSDFWIKVNSNAIPLYSRFNREIEKIFILSIEKIKKKEIKKDLRQNIQFFDGNKFFDFLFNISQENVPLISNLYPTENKTWDELSQNQQKSFCENINVEYVEFERLWKYPIGQQSKIIVSMQTTGKNGRKRTPNEEQDQKREQRKEYRSDQSNSILQKFYDILEIDENATASQIKKAYKELIKFYHPDKFETKSVEDKKRALSKAKKITEAYEELQKAGKVD